MYSFLESNQALQSAVKNLWNDYKDKVFFEPVVDTEFGDAVSPCPQMLGRFLKKSPKEVKILKPGDSYMREDGTIGTNYNVKKVYDITQVSIKDIARQMRYDNVHNITGD